MYILPDASPAFGKEIVPGRGHIQFFIFICRGNLAVGAGFNIDVIQRIILFGKACRDLIVYFFLPCDLRFYFPLPVLCVNIVETDDQARPLLFFHHGGVQLDMKRFVVHQDTIHKRECSVVRYFRQHVFLCTDRKKTVQVVRMIIYAGRVVQGGKEICSVLRL